MAKQQPVFEDVATDARLYLSDFQRFAAAENATITFKFGEELYHVDAQQLTLSYLAHDSAPVDPLLAFNDVGGFPYIRLGDLKEMPGGQPGGEPPYFRVERRKGAVGQLSLFGWRGMVKEVSRIVGRDASTPPDTGLRSLLEYRGGVPPEYLEVASRSQQPGETFGQALVRLDFATPRDLLFAALGGSRLFNPTCHMANAVGRLLLEAGAIAKEDFESAVKAQVSTGKSLAAILHKNGACGGSDIARALEQLRNWTIFLPPTDKMGEVLVKRGKISRTQLMSALFKIQGTDQKLGDYLVEEELATRQEVAEAEAWHDLKLRARTAGKVRLGQVLLENQTISESQLKKALRIQVDKGEPLGEILMSEGLCPPEAVIEGLLEQEHRLNELVAAAVAGVDDGKLEETPLFDIPPSTLKGRNKKKPAEEGSDSKGTKGGKGAKGKTGKLSGKGRTAKLDPGAAKGKGGRNAKGKDGDSAEERRPLPWKPILGGVAAVVVFGALAFATVRLVGNLSKPGGLLAAKPPASQATATPAPAAGAGAGQQPTAPDVGNPAGAPAGNGSAPAAPPAAPGGPDPAAAAQAVAQGAPPPGLPAAQAPVGGPAGGPAGGLRQQAAAQSTLQGDRTTLSHLSNEELRNIAKKNPAFVTADDVEAKGGRIGEVLAKAEKADPNFAKAVAAARMTSGANILNQELDNLENDAPGQLMVRETGGSSTGGAAGAQGQAQAAASFRSAQSGDGPGGQAGEAPGQFGQALSGDLAPGAVTDPRRQVRAFAGAAPPPGGAPAAQGGFAGPAGAGGQAPAGRVAGTARQAAPGTVRQAAPGTVRQAAPGTVQQAAPGTLQQAAPETPRQAAPGTVRRAAPGTVQQGAPGTVQQGAPGTVRQAAPVGGGQPAAGQLRPGQLQPVEDREARLQAILDENALRQQLARNPADTGAANGLALAFIAKGQPAEAERLLRKAQAAKPTDPVVNQNLAAALMAQKKDAAAVPLLRKSEAAFRARTAAEVKQAQAAATRKDYKAAETRLKNALRSQTLSADAAFRLGTAHQRQGNAAQAKIYLRKAAEGYMGAGKLHTSLGEVYSRRGNRKMAIYEYKLAAKLDPRAGRPWYLLGKEALAQKKVGQAYKYLQTALKKEPRAPYAKEVRALLAD